MKQRMGWCGSWTHGSDQEQAALVIYGTGSQWRCSTCRVFRPKKAHVRPFSKWREALRWTLTQKESSVASMSLDREHSEQSRAGCTQDNGSHSQRGTKAKELEGLFQSPSEAEHQKIPRRTGWWFMGTRMEPLRQKLVSSKWVHAGCPAVDSRATLRNKGSCPLL